jgi:hypothetical protein
MAIIAGERAMIFRDREDAGRALPQKLQAYANRKDVIVLGAPRLSSASFGAPACVCARRFQSRRKKLKEKPTKLLTQRSAFIHDVS